MFLIIQEMFKSDNVYLLIYHLLRQYKKKYRSFVYHIMGKCTDFFKRIACDGNLVFNTHKTHNF